MQEAKMVSGQMAKLTGLCLRIVLKSSGQQYYNKPDPTHQGNVLEIAEQRVVGTRCWHNYTGEKRKLTASQQKRKKKQAVETHFVPKQRSLQTSITTRVSPASYKVQRLLTVTPRHQNKLPLFSEDRAETLPRVLEKVRD